jgi:peptidoglycan/LPS O-acetylase OafA/YrhL
MSEWRQYRPFFFQVSFVPATSKEIAGKHSMKVKNGFVPELEAGRGVAALLVAGFHISNTPIIVNGVHQALLYERDAIPSIVGTILQHIHRLVTAGHKLAVTPGVLFFFALSGFVLTGALQRRWISLPQSVLEFLVGRIFRLFPAAIATIMVFWLIYKITGHRSVGPEKFDIQHILMNMFLIESAIDGVMWTLQTEVLALPLIFGLFLVHKAFGLKGVTAITLAMTILPFTDWWADLYDWGGGEPRVRWLFAFAFGGIAYHLLLAGKISSRVNIMIGWTGVIAFFVLPTVMASSILPTLDQDLYFPTMVIYGILTSLAASAIIYALASGDSGVLGGVLAHSAFRFLGKISYSFYLMHPITLMFVWNMPDTFGLLVASGIPRAVVSISLWALTVAAIVPLAWASYLFVEKPAQRVGNAIRDEVANSTISWAGLRSRVKAIL